MTLKRLLILTGDPSADMHAAHIVTALRQRAGEPIDIHAVGGAHLQAQGVALISDQSKMARIGFGSVMGAYDHWRLGEKILAHCQGWMPDAVLFIDYGVFHLWLASQLKKRFKERCPKLYYFIPPQIWATRRGRIKKIKRHIDHVFCIFPFEKALYEAHGVPVTYVGHPLASQLPAPLSRQEFCQNQGKDLQLDADKPIIGLFPGSRQLELDYLLLPILKAACLINNALARQSPDPAKFSGAQFVIARSPHFSPEAFRKKLDEAIAALPQTEGTKPAFHVLGNANHAILSASDALVLASGTVTLEAALYGTPLMLIYKLHPIVYQVAIRLVQVPFIGLPNILYCIGDINRAKETALPPVVAELWQDEATPEAIAAQTLALLNEKSETHLRQKKAFETIRAMLQNTQHEAASTAVADALLNGA